jgi:hypothetical protein
MGYPRTLQVPPDTPGFYHCVSRCVRRAYLCGEDPLTGRCFEHRRQWLESRLLELADIFAVAVHAYAVMSNHIHVVLEIDPGAPAGWDDEAVARRWLRLCAPRSRDEPSVDARLAALTACPQRLDVLRQRLGSLSWFMRFLKEPIARRANREDGCSGRFWEGRFRTQALLDDAAVLACMAYVDLNPVRAGRAATARQARHTSLRRRARTRAPRLEPVAASIPAHPPPLSEPQYLTLVHWTGRRLYQPDAPPQRPPEALAHLPMSPRQWLAQVPATENRYWRAIGRLESLLAMARRTGQHWLRGIGTARALQGLLQNG